MIDEEWVGKIVELSRRSGADYDVAEKFLRLYEAMRQIEQEEHEANMGIALMYEEH